MAWWIVLTCVLVAIAAFGYLFFVRDADFIVSWAARDMPKVDAFKGKVAWVVGASSGIGEALAYELAKGGCTLILSARRTDRLMAVQDKCHELGAPDVYVLRVDVKEMGSHEAIAANAVKKFGKLDYLINNAGRSQRGLAEATPLAVDREMFELNFFGVLSITKAVLPTFIKQKYGHIINTSSVAGKMGSPRSATYSATKHAIQGFFDALRMECAEHNLLVTNVCPGPVASEITLHAFTEVVGKSHDKPQEAEIKRMTAERCAFLMSVAMWAKLPEIWVSPQPILSYLYMAQYLPTLYHRLSPIFGRKAVAGVRSGQPVYVTVQNPVMMFISSLFSTPATSASEPAAATKHE